MTQIHQGGAPSPGNPQARRSFGGRLLLVWRLAARDVARHRVESLLAFFVLATSAAALTVAFALSGVANRPYEQTRAATAGPDVIADVFSDVPGSGASTSTSSSAGTATALAAVIHAPGVRAHSGPYLSVYGTVHYRGHRVDAVVEGRDATPSRVDRPHVTRGSWIRPGGAVLERGFAEALGARIGDAMQIGGVRLTIVGVAVTAAVPAYPSSLCHLACLMSVPQNMGLVWVGRSVPAQLAAHGATSSYLVNLTLADPTKAEAFAAARQGQASGHAVAVLYAWQSIRSADAALIQIEQAGLQFGGWLLGLLALAGLAVLVGRRMSEQTRRVGLLKAVGATPSMVALVLLVQHVVLAGAASAVGLLAGRLISPQLASTGAGLLGSAGAPSMGAVTILVVAGTALGVAALASFGPAIRAARTSTVAALADAPRTPARRSSLLALSRRLPVPLLLAVRQTARRPRRALLNAASVAVTVTGIVAILDNAANRQSPGRNGIANLKIERLNELMLIITVMLIVLAAINTTFIAWASAADGRFASALQRALGATTRQLVASSSIAAALPALPAAVLGVPVGLGVYHLIDRGSALTTPPAWQLAGVVIATLVAVVTLTSLPTRLAARRSPVQILQAE